VVGAEFAADVESVDVGQCEVEQDKIGHGVGDRGECGSPGGNVHDVECFGPQHAFQRLADPFVVLDEQHVGHGPTSERNAPDGVTDANHNRAAATSGSGPDFTDQMSLGTRRHSDVTGSLRWRGGGGRWRAQGNPRVRRAR